MKCIIFDVGNIKDNYFSSFKSVDSIIISKKEYVIEINGCGCL